MQINYKSDFDFFLNLKSGDADVGWPDFDWSARFFTSQKVNAYVVSCIGGVCTNCFNDGGRIHVVMDNHHLGPGQLRVAFTVEIPNGVYPDSSERLVIPDALDIVLVRDSSDVPDAIQAELMLPFILADIPQYGSMVFVTDAAEYSIPVCRLPAQRNPLFGSYYGYYYYYADGGGIGQWDL